MSEEEGLALTVIGTRVAETSNLLRDGGVFYLRRQPRGGYKLRRTPVKLVKKRVRLIGTLLSRGVIDADCIAHPAYCTVFPSCSYDRSYDYSLHLQLVR